jgi:hypothetical protein
MFRESHNSPMWRTLKGGASGNNNPRPSGTGLSTVDFPAAKIGGIITDSPDPLGRGFHFDIRRFISKER